MLNILLKPSNLFKLFAPFSKLKNQRQLYLASLISNKIKNSEVFVQDVSEGHQQGSKYVVYVESDTFKDTTAVQQHNLVKNALKKELKNIKSVQIRTKVRPQQMEKASAPNTPGSTNPDERRMPEGMEGQTHGQGQTETTRGTAEIGVTPIGGGLADGSN